MAATDGPAPFSRTISEDLSRDRPDAFDPGWGGSTDPSWDLVREVQQALTENRMVFNEAMQEHLTEFLQETRVPSYDFGSPYSDPSSET